VDGSEAGILRRVQEYLFGNAELAQIDRQRIAHLFPLTVNALIAAERRLGIDRRIARSRRGIRNIRSLSPWFTATSGFS
jgi:hypothetical protein